MTRQHTAKGAVAGAGRGTPGAAERTARGWYGLGVSSREQAYAELERMETEARAKHQAAESDDAG
jgi:hypothetical protein